MEIRRKLRPGDPLPLLAHSRSSAELARPDPGRYRLAPPRAPDVPALVRPGMLVRTSYSTGGIVIAVEGPVIHIGPDGSEYPHFTIVYVPVDCFGRHSKLDRNWINECVAVDGRILKLFEANSDEVFIEAVAACPPWPFAGEGPPSTSIFPNQARYCEWSAGPFRVSGEPYDPVSHCPSARRRAGFP